MFTKVVTHRSRKGTPRPPRNVAAFHVATVIADAGAIFVALIATEVHCEALGFDIAAWITLGAAGAHADLRRV
jgi:hypothetical protein